MKSATRRNSFQCLDINRFLARATIIPPANSIQSMECSIGKQLNDPKKFSRLERPFYDM